MSFLKNPGGCEEIMPLLVFYACGELTAAESEQVQAHLTECQECAEQLKAEQQFVESLGAMPQAADQIDSAGILLSQCRSELAESLDDLTRPVAGQDSPTF